MKSMINRTSLLPAAAVWAAALLAGCEKNSLETTPDTKAFTLTSPMLTAGGVIPQRHWLNGFGCTGDNIRPALAWSGAPTGTKSYAITVFDNDAPTSAGFGHWVVHNIPASTNGLTEGPGNLPAGAVEGNNDLGSPAWFGSCPSDWKTHRYTYAVFALGVEKLDVPAGATAAFTSFNIQGNAIGRANLDGIAKM